VARMSIDDMILRDTRVLRLARLCGQDKHGTIGRLLAVFAIVYDRVDDTLDVLDIDLAAELDGFAGHMVTADLAVQVRKRIRVRGAEKRLEYLRTREESGREGGLKSGETRRNRAKQDSKVTFDKPEGPVNPPVPDPVLVPVPDPALPDPVAVVPDPAGPKSKSKPRKTSKVAHQHPSDWTPRPEERLMATASGLDCDSEALAFRDHHTAKGSRFEDWDAAFRTWLRNAVKFANNRRTNGLTPLEQQFERVRMLEAQEAEQKALALP
jgi:hypothetical protein